MLTWPKTYFINYRLIHNSKWSGWKWYCLLKIAFIKNWIYFAFKHGELAHKEVPKSQVKGKDLGESGKQNCEPLFAQNSDFELWMVEPFANERESTPKLINLPMKEKFNNFSIGEWGCDSQFKIWIWGKKGGPFS